jgi:hypothetical protein
MIVHFGIGFMLDRWGLVAVTSAQVKLHTWNHSVLNDATVSSIVIEFWNLDCSM